MNSHIQCTEIYEYALSLGNPTFTLTPLALYKYVYSVRLMEAGMGEEVRYTNPHYIVWRRVSVRANYFILGGANIQFPLECTDIQLPYFGQLAKV